MNLNLKNYIEETQVSIYPLVTFRIVLGFLLIISTARFIQLGWVDEHFVETSFQFKFFGFEWVALPPPLLIHALHWIMLAAALFFTLGFFYRVAAILLFCIFTYIQLIDLTYYLNHYYFVSLILLLMCFVPAHRYMSIDSKVFSNIESRQTAAWQIDILKFQIFCVYFFAGIAKINESWLFEALPLKIWLPAHDKFPVLGAVFDHEWSPYLFSWGGMFYDTFIVFFLLWRPTRFWAYCLVIVFHCVVGILFQIGVFPLVMIGVTLLFFSAEWHQKLLDKLNSILPKLPKMDFSWPKLKVGYPLKALLICGFVTFQLIFPMRYLLYPGNVFWTEEGYRFSWRVMLMEKAGTATFYVKDTESGREGIVDNSEFLNPHQEKQMSFQPDMILQFAHFLGKHYEKEGVKTPEVRVEAWVTLNGKPSQLIVDPKIDLMKISDSWRAKDWIMNREE